MDAAMPVSFNQLKNCSKTRIDNFCKRYIPKNSIISSKLKHRALWYKMQCEDLKLNVLGKHITKLKKYSQAPEKFTANGYKIKYQLKDGMEIIKDYKGRKYKVHIQSQNEFLYEGLVYKSLSAVAKSICHKKVSGYDFFGLNNKNYKNGVVNEVC